MSKQRRVTLREIAEKTGITRMAVSLALRGKAGVGEETRKEVLRAAQELGYAPDPEVAKLMAHIRARAPAETHACLALLTSGSKPDAWKLYRTERQYVEGAQARAREYGYHTEEFWMNEPGMSPARLGNIIWNRGIEGVIIPPLQGPLPGREARAVRLDFNLFSVVEISETVEWPDLDRAIHDQYTSMLRLLDELASLQYRSPALVLEKDLDARVNGRWTAAYLQFRLRTGNKLMPIPLIMEGPDQKAFDRWFDKHQPDIVISVNKFGIRLLRARGLKIPQEVGYASLDVDGDVADFPGLSGINQNSQLVGAAAVDMVVAAIHRNHRGIPDHPVRTEVEGTWVAGNSTVRRRLK